MTPREIDVATRAARGEPSKAIAADRGISALTVEAHLQRVFHKPGVNRRQDLEEILTPSAG